MSKLSNLSDKDIHEAIAAMQNGIAIKLGGEEAKALQTSIDRALEELQRRAQKKSQEQPAGNTGQLSKEIDIEAGLKEIANREWPKIREKLEAQENGKELVEKLEQFAESDIPPLPSDMLTGQQLLDKWEREGYKPTTQNEKALETRVSVGRASETSVIIPAVFVKIAGEDRLLTQTEIIGYLKTYFKRVATSERMKSGQYTAAYASEMGKTVWRLFDGWNLIYKEMQEGSEWPPMVDIFPGWKNAQQAHKVTADVLWRWASSRKE